MHQLSSFGINVVGFTGGSMLARWILDEKDAQHMRPKSRLSLPLCVACPRARLEVKETCCKRLDGVTIAAFETPGGVHIHVLCSELEAHSRRACLAPSNAASSLDRMPTEAACRLTAPQFVATMVTGGEHHIELMQ